MGLVETTAGLRSRAAALRGQPPAEVVRALRRAVRYDDRALGLVRDLAVPHRAPDARVPLEVRPLADRDVGRLLDPRAPGLSEEERHERRDRLRLLDAGLRTPWVAVTDDGTAVYVQWLLGPDQADAVARHFGDGFPRLRPDQALLEGAYTPSTQRGRRIMPAAMARIAERAADLGARYVLTFVSDGNEASLAGCRRAGFAPGSTRTTRVRALRRSVVFADLPEQAAPA